MTLGLDPDPLAHDGLGELYPDDWDVPAPVPRRRGKAVNDVGRSGPHPHATRARDPLAPKQREASHRLDFGTSPLGRGRRAAVEAGRTAHLSFREPTWSAGSRVTIVRHGYKSTNAYGRAEFTRDAPLSVVVSSVLALPIGDITAEQVRPLGFRIITDFARDYLDLDEHIHALSLQARLKRDRTPAWLTRWRVELRHDVRLLPAAGGGGDDYEGARSRSMRAVVSPLPGDLLRWRPEDPGEAVDEETQREITAKAQASIGAGAKKGREKTAREEDERRKLNKAAYRVKARPAPRRVARKATLPRGEE